MDLQVKLKVIQELTSGFVEAKSDVGVKAQAEIVVEDVDGELSAT